MSSTIKTHVTAASVANFLDAIPNETRRADGKKLLEMFSRITGEEPKMWGPTMVGFGAFHYKSERSRQEGDWLITGFSPRKASLSLYVLGFKGEDALLQKLGKHKKGVGCLYVNKLADIDTAVLEEMIEKSYKDVIARYGKM